MGLFTPKRRKSAAQDTAPRQIYDETPAVPTPIFARHQQTSNGVFIDQKSPYAPMEMPDLRFSKLDLDVDMNRFKGGPDSRPGSVAANGEERRKSKMALFNFNSNSRGSLTTNNADEYMVPARKSSTPNTLTDGSSVRSGQTAQRSVASMGPTGPMEQDRKKLVASATEAMNLDVPVKAPAKAPALLSNDTPLVKTKKELKKEEKERVAREKAAAEREKAAREKARANFEREKASRAVMEMDRARQAARDAAIASRKEEQTARRISSMDMYAPPAKKQTAPDLRPMTVEQRRMLNASANNVNPLRGPPNGIAEERSRSKSPAPSSTSSRRPPSLPPSQRPPPPPVSNKYAPAKPQNQPRQDSAAPAAKSGSYQFPRQPGGPVVHRSQSAIPAADGVARPVVVRGQTGMIEPPTLKSPGGAPQIGSFGVPMTSSPPMHSKSTFTSNRTGNSSYRSPQKMARGSSSDERSSTSADGPSMESITSIEDNDLADDPNERFVDASNNFARRPRPRRDEEREERAQSRLSGHFDSDVIRSGDGHYHTRTDSSTDKFAALLAASRPGGAGDRSADAAEVQAAKERLEAQRRRYLNQAPAAVRPAPPPPQPIKRIREVAPRPKRSVIVRPQLVDQGVGWSCQGVGDLYPENTRERTVVETIRVPKVGGQSTTEQDANGNEVGPEMVDKQIRVRYNDLFELIWTSTTPDVISRLISHLDISDLKALRQTSHSIRFTLDYHDNREMILNQHLGSIGYRTWSPIKGAPSARTAGRIIPSNMSKDPCPLSFNDCEAFLISHDLLPEYAAVGKEFAARGGNMDPRMARLAQASTRAYSRVLTRLRLQPVFKIPKPSSPGHAGRVDNSSSGLSATPTQLDVVNAANQKHNSYYPLKGPTGSPALALQLDGKTPPSPADSGLTFSPAISSPLSTSLSPATMNIDTFSDTATQIKSPWKPGRAAFYRVWVPASDPNGWLIDSELTECESQLYKAGIWNFLKKGDVVWDTAVGDQVNEGKYIFDGHYLRDLSYAHDPAGHLPSWLNCVLFSPSYWHNIIHSSSPRPVIYFDISPWKEQILNSLRLVQDHVEGFSNTGNRYRIAKWLYRSAANITCGQIISKMSGSLEIVDEGWNGRIVIETEGTAEHAKALISRCAGPNASPQAKAALLATVMGDAKAAIRAMKTNDTHGLTQSSLISEPASKSSEVQNSPWMIMRERSRPGLIWIKLA